MKESKFKVGDRVKVKKNTVTINKKIVGGMRNSQKNLDE